MAVIQRTSGLPQEAEFLHAPFFPAPVRPGERIEAKLVRVGDQVIKDWILPVWRISPFGVELVLRGAHLHIDNGTELDINLIVGKQTARFLGLVVEAQYEEKGQQIIGVRWLTKSDDRSEDQERRAEPRWVCSQHFFPTGVAMNPVRFNDFMHFRVRDISSGGMQLVTSLRNKYLVPGMIIDSMVSFPALGYAKIKLEVVSPRIFSEEGKEFLSIGALMINPNPHAMRIIGQYLLQFGSGATPEMLRKRGFGFVSVKDAVTYGYVRTDEEYDQVLALRRLAYSRAGLVSPEAPLSNMSDIFDTRSRILIAKHGGGVIGTMRLIYHEPDQQFEHETLAGVFPENFPRKDESVEITRLCTHPDYRKDDLLAGMFQHALLTVLQSGKRWIVTGAGPTLTPLYTRIGFKKTAVTFKPKAYEGQGNFVVLLGDVHSAALGKGIDPLSWNLLFGKVWDYLDPDAALEREPLDTLRIGAFRLLGPLASILARRIRRPRKVRRGSGPQGGQRT